MWRSQIKNSLINFIRPLRPFCLVKLFYLLKMVEKSLTRQNGLSGLIKLIKEFLICLRHTYVIYISLSISTSWTIIVAFNCIWISKLSLMNFLTNFDVTNDESGFFQKTRSVMVPRFGFFSGFTNKGWALTVKGSPNTIGCHENGSACL